MFYKNSAILTPKWSFTKIMNQFTTTEFFTVANICNTCSNVLMTCLKLSSKLWLQNSKQYDKVNTSVVID